MGPVRTVKSSRSQDDTQSSNTAGSSTQRRYKSRRSQRDANAVPGAQKIKSLLRQARRLLSKEKLAADVRVETERRIKSLEADLAQTQMSRKERDNALRYHKVKFFALERRKVIRKLNQTKKLLASADASSRLQLEEALAELRIDLNYIIHYPKTKKYISLFPPEIREDAMSQGATIKVNPNSEEVRNWVRRQMEAGEISKEPEMEVTKQEAKDVKPAWPEGTRTNKEAVLKSVREEEEDAFFGDDTDEEEGNDNDH